MTPHRYDWDDDEPEDDAPECDVEDDDDEDDEAQDDEPDEDEEDDDEAVFQRIERAFRQERANIRACDDLGELRQLRTSYLDLAESGVREAGRVRAHDLVELIDDRITDLKAQRLARRGR